jgi:hypothetical protein
MTRFEEPSRLTGRRPVRCRPLCTAGHTPGACRAAGCVPVPDAPDALSHTGWRTAIHPEAVPPVSGTPARCAPPPEGPDIRSLCGSRSPPRGHSAAEAGDCVRPPASSARSATPARRVHTGRSPGHQPHDAGPGKPQHNGARAQPHPTGLTCQHCGSSRTEAAGHTPPPPCGIGVNTRVHRRDREEPVRRRQATADPASVMEGHRFT